MTNTFQQMEEGILFAEQSLLGEILRKDDSWCELDNRVRAELFNNTAHRAIFDAMAYLKLFNHPIEINTVVKQLTESNNIELVGGYDYLENLVLNARGSANFGYYIDVLYNCFVRKSLVEASGKIGMLATNPSRLTSGELIDKSAAYIGEIPSGAGLEIKTFVDLLPSYLDDLEKEDDDIVSTGFHNIDSFLNGGMRPGQLIIVAGVPGMGKTTFGLNILKNVAIKSDKTTLVFSMEMSDKQIQTKLISCGVGVPSLVDNKSNKHMIADAISKTLSYSGYHKIIMDTRGGLSLHEIRSFVRLVKRKKPDLCFIMIDYLGLMKTESKYQNKAQDIAEITMGLKALAKEVNIPIMLLCQLNRSSVVGAEVRKPRMSDLRDSGAIEQDADIVMLIYREDKYSDAKSGIADIIIDKNRMGEVGIANLIFDGKHHSYKDHNIRV